MANNNDLKAAIQAVIKSNGNNEITGAILQSTILSIINAFANGSIYKGIATPATAPGTPDQNVFYLATAVGTYSNFNAYEHTGGLVLFDNRTGTWVATKFDLANGTQTASGINIAKLAFVKRSANAWKDILSINNNTGTITFPSNIIYSLPFYFSNFLRFTAISIQFDISKEWGIAAIQLPDNWMTSNNTQKVIEQSDVQIWYYGDAASLKTNMVPLFYWNRNDKSIYSPFFTPLLNKENVAGLSSSVAEPC